MLKEVNFAEEFIYFDMGDMIIDPWCCINNTEKNQSYEGSACQCSKTYNNEKIPNIADNY